MKLFSAILFISLLGTSEVFADAIASGQKLSATCLACHGEKGLSSNDLWPNLAGQKKAYLIKQLLAFQSGDRKDPLMTPMSGTLSKEDVENVATYYSSLKGL
jgi:cytochrome c553